MPDGAMPRAGLFCAGALLAFVVGTPGALAVDRAAEPFTERPGLAEFSGRLIVRVRQDLPGARADGARARLAPLAITRCAATDEYLLKAPPVPVAPGGAPRRGSAENDLAARLRVTGDYEYITPDWRCWPQATTTTNDPFLSLQWHHARINSFGAWYHSAGSPSVIVAFVDTGIDLAHPDLAASRVSGYNSASHLAESAGGLVNDIVGHGTHVAGCGAAIGNNGVGGAGVGWALKLMMVRTTNDSWGTSTVWDLLEGARWASDHGARVVSVSYAGVETPSVQTTGAYIRAQGGLLIFAADNTSTDHGGFDWPDVLVVGAVNQSDQLAWFSSYGAAVDVVAPGTSIYSTKRYGGYEYRDGTSFAAPLVAGLAGVLWSINPALTSQQVESFILGGCGDLGAPGDDNVFGRGVVNAFESVKLAAGSLGPAAPIAMPDTAGAVGGTPAVIDVMANDYDVNGDSLKVGLMSDRSALGATLARSVGTGPGGRDQIQYFAPNTLAGTDSFQYQITDTTGRSSFGIVTVSVTPHCTADVDFSGFVNAEDFEVFMVWFLAGDKRADLDRNGFVNAADFDFFVSAYITGC